MTFYLDTSLLVTLYTNEPDTALVRAWAVELPVRSTSISEWTVTEFSAALSIKLRTGQLDEAARGRALAAFRADRAAILTTHSIRTGDFERAAWLADRAATGLRAADALHLAIIEGRGATLCTRDRRLAQAAGELGYPVELIRSDAA